MKEDKEDIYLTSQIEELQKEAQIKELQKEIEELKAALARSKEDHQYDNLVHQKELETLRNPIHNLRKKGVM